MAERAATATSRGTALLALVVAGTALVVIDITIVTIGLPEIQADLGGVLADVQWVIIAYTVTMGAVTQAVGSLSDQVGRRRLYLVGAALFTLSSLGCGLAPNVLLLDAGRVLQGIGGAILMTSALPLLSHAFEGQRRTMAITTWGTASTAAALVAPLLGGVLVDALGWRSIFLINVPIGIAVVLIGLRVLPADPERGDERTSIDWTGIALLVVSLGLANYAFLQGEQQGWASALTIIQFAVAIALLAVFVVIEARVSVPTLDPRLFRRPAFVGAALAVLMSRVLTVGGTVYVVQYAQSSLHLTSSETGLLLTPAFVAQIVAGMLAGKMLAKLPAGRVIASGYVFKLAGGLWLGLMLTPSTAAWTLAFPLLLWGTGGGIAGAPVMAVAMNVTDKERAGMVAGTITSLASIGAGLGTAVLGAVYTTRLGTVAAERLPAELPSRDTVAAAIADGDVARALDAVPSALRADVSRVVEEATAAAGSAALLGSAGLAAVTTCVVLALLNNRTVPREPRS